MLATEWLSSLYCRDFCIVLQYPVHLVWALLNSKLSFRAVCRKQNPSQVLDQATESIAGTLYSAVLLFRSKRNSSFPIEVTSNPAVFRKWGDGCWHAVVVTALVSRLHCTRWWFQLSIAFLIHCLVHQPPPFTYATTRGCAVVCSKSLVGHRLKIIFYKEELRHWATVPPILQSCSAEFL